MLSPGGVRVRRLLGLALGLAVFALVPAGAAPPVVVPRLDAHADPLPPGALLRLGTTRLRHGESVTHLAFAASDRELLTLTLHSGHLRRWNVQTGGSLGPVRMGGRQPGLTDALFSADGRWLVMFGSQPFVLVDSMWIKLALSHGRDH